MNLEALWNKLSAGHVDEAISDVTSALESDIESATTEALVLWADCCTAADELEDAEETLNGILRKSPSNIKALVKRSSVYYRQKQWDKSIIDLTQVIQKGENTESELMYAYKWRGYARYCNRDYPAAIEDMNTYLSLQPEDREILLYRAYSYQELNDHLKALVDFESVLSRDSSNHEVILKKAYSNFKLRNWELSVSDLTHYIRLKPDDSYSYYLRSWAYWHLNNLEKCYRDLEYLVNKFSGSSLTAYSHSARIRFYAGDPKEAIANLDSYMSINPSSWIDCMKGLVHYFSEDFASAIHACSKALEINPDHTLAIYIRCNSYFESGEHDNAANDFRRVLNIAKDPRNDLENPERVNLDSEREYEYYHRGLARLRFENSDGARADFENSKELFEKFGDRLRLQLANDRLAELSQ